MIKVLFATGNETKAKRFSKGLQEKGIEIITLKDINKEIEIEENGKNAIENALIKARAYSKIIDIPVLAMDDNLFLENIPEEKQPGIYVRRVNGKRLSDEKMIEYYTNLVKQYGTNGKLTCRWVYGIALINNKKESTYTWSKEDFYMVDTPTNKLNNGYPLNTISINKKLNKYFTDITEEDKKLLNEDESDVVEFIANAIYEKEIMIKSQHTNEKLYTLEKTLIEKFKREEYKNPSLTLHGSMVWGFAYHLPYSMDIEQEEYVPGDFLNIEPKDVDENNWFKWEDRRTIYNAMYRWTDTRKSGILLQTCYVFQQMLLGNISPYIATDEETYYTLGINKFTDDEEYNKKFFNILQKLPNYYEKVITSENNIKRREVLKETYNEICSNIEMKVGGFTKYNTDGTTKSYSPATISYKAHMDVEMIIDGRGSTIFFDGLKLDITKSIKEIQLKNNKKKENSKKISKLKQNLN